MERRQFLKSGVLLAGNLVPSKALGSLEAMVQSGISFYHAKHYPYQREAYMKQIMQRYPPPLANLRVFFPEAQNPRSAAPKGFVTGFYFGGKWADGKVTEPFLNVYSEAFDIPAYEHELLCSLVDHEYIHMELMVGRVSITTDEGILPELQSRAFNMAGDLFKIFMELYTYKHQLNSFPKYKNLRANYKTSIASSYRMWRRQLEEKPMTPLTVWMLKEFPEK